MGKYVWFCFLLISTHYLAGQMPGKIYGHVISDHQPLPGATVTLLNPFDSSRFMGVITGASGLFAFSVKEAGNFLVQVSYAGCPNYISKPFLIKNDAVINLGTIELMPGMDKQLSEVVVTAKRQLYERKLDRTIINVDGLLTNQGVSAYDILDKSPGIIIDPVNGGISLEGKSGVTVYIDDRKSNLSGADLAAYLQSLPSGSIATIELIINPTAKYEATGGPVINIKLKRDIPKGFTGNASVLYGHWQYGKTDERFNFDYRYGKFNILGSAGINQQNYASQNYQDRQYLNMSGNPDSFYALSNFTHGKGYTLSPQIAIDYYAGKNTTWGIVLNQVYRPISTSGQTKNSLSKRSNQVDSIIFQDFNAQRIFSSSYGNLNLRHQFDKKTEILTVDADFNRFVISNDQYFYNSKQLSGGPLTDMYTQTGNTPSEINIYALKSDYVRPLKDGYEFEIGCKASATNADNTASYFSIISAVSQPDYLKTNHFKYKENIYAAYLNITKEWKRFSMESGLRMERTISAGHQLGNLFSPDSSFRRVYTGLFPALFMQYKMDSTGSNTVGLSFGRRIDRPAYQDLNPFIIPEDNYNYDAGNPYLQPSYIYNLEFSYSYKSILTFKSFFSKSINDIQVVDVLRDGIIYSTYANLGKYAYTGFSVNGNLSPVKWAQLNVFGQVKFENTEGVVNGKQLSVGGTVAYLQGNLRFILGKGWNTELNGLYQSPTRNIQFDQDAVARLNAVFQKKISDHLTARLVFTDFLDLFKYGGKFNNLVMTEATYKNTFDTQGFNVGLNYRFGKSIKGLRQHRDDASDTEQGRVKK